MCIVCLPVVLGFPGDVCQKLLCYGDYVFLWEESAPALRRSGARVRSIKGDPFGADMARSAHPHSVISGARAFVVRNISLSAANAYIAQRCCSRPFALSSQLVTVPVPACVPWRHRAIVCGYGEVGKFCVSPSMVVLIMGSWTDVSPSLVDNKKFAFPGVRVSCWQFDRKSRIGNTGDWHLCIHFFWPTVLYVEFSKMLPLSHLGFCGQFDFVCVPVDFKHCASNRFAFINLLNLDQNRAEPFRISFFQYARTCMPGCQGSLCN